MEDTVLNELAKELRAALIAQGLDVKNPPEDNGRPPTDKAFAEYLKRGGAQYMDPDKMMDALIKKVGE